ncbi:hypothetical protein AT302_08960 [Pandoraea norimbergensis]|uniref:Uncharacterized protein n=1 Tax=Pandoraea norimbergensis TaxID=93219 RepID=A0ABM5WHM2_9BURK|nr:hypothetical protein AT302_08960 [Pandoraea norimbergensis]
MRDLNQALNLRRVGLPPLQIDATSTIVPPPASYERRAVLRDALRTDLASVRRMPDAEEAPRAAPDRHARGGTRNQDGRRGNLAVQPGWTPPSARRAAIPAAYERRPEPAVDKDLPPSYESQVASPLAYTSLNVPPPYAPPDKAWLGAFFGQLRRADVDHG